MFSFGLFTQTLIPTSGILQKNTNTHPKQGNSAMWFCMSTRYVKIKKGLRSQEEVPYSLRMGIFAKKPLLARKQYSLLRFSSTVQISICPAPPRTRTNKNALAALSAASAFSFFYRPSRTRMSSTIWSNSWRTRSSGLPCRYMCQNKNVVFRLARRIWLSRGAGSGMDAWRQ